MNPKYFTRVDSSLLVDSGQYIFSYEIPPINTQATPLTNLAYGPGVEAVMKRNEEEVPGLVPEQWTREDAARQGIILDPEDQGRCGACWVIVVSQNITDQIATETRRGLRQTPLPAHPPSFTWSLACFARSDPCGGGDVASLLVHARKYGIPARTCEDWSWCARSDCVSKDVPKCGCSVAGSHDVYHIKGPPIEVYIGAASSSTVAGVSVSPEQCAVLIKKYILRRGSIIANIHLYRNFLDGKFCFCNGGVYLELIHYERLVRANQEPQFSKELPAGKYQGGHAVCVVGWGTVSCIVDGVLQNVDYWLCRNSWGKTWGEDGFFKLATHKWNRFCQIENPVFVKVGVDEDPWRVQERVPTGGLVVFDADFRHDINIL